MLAKRQYPGPIERATLVRSKNLSVSIRYVLCILVSLRYLIMSFEKQLNAMLKRFKLRNTSTKGKVRG